MDEWKSQAIDALKLLEVRRQAAESLRVRRLDMEEDAVSITSVCCDKTPLKGGGNRQQERMADSIDRRDKLAKKEQSLRELVHNTEVCLASLGERERAVLDALYIHRRNSAVSWLEKHLHISRAEVYRTKDRALEEFAIRMGYL